jgi:hypothetical protein
MEEQKPRLYLSHVRSAVHRHLDPSQKILLSRLVPARGAPFPYTALFAHTML